MKNTKISNLLLAYKKAYTQINDSSSMPFLNLLLAYFFIALLLHYLLRATEIFWEACLFQSFPTRYRWDLFQVKHVLICEPLEEFSNEFCNTKIELTIERFHTRGQHLCKFILTKESIQIRKSSTPTGFVSKTKHGHRFIVLGHQNCCRNVM